MLCIEEQWKLKYKLRDRELVGGICVALLLTLLERTKLEAECLISSNFAITCEHNSCTKLINGSKDVLVLTP